MEPASGVITDTVLDLSPTGPFLLTVLVPGGIAGVWPWPWLFLSEKNPTGAFAWTCTCWLPLAGESAKVWETAPV